MKSQRSQSKKTPKRRSRSKSAKSKNKSSRHAPKKAKEKKVNIFKQLTKKDKIYLDTNATTPMCKEAIKALEAWASCGNPSSSSNSGKEAKKIIEHAITEICKHCHISPKSYTVLFTPSASASNSQILQSTSQAYKQVMGRKPHIITSSIEHKSLLSCVEALRDRDEIELSCISPDIYGRINPTDVEKKIKPNTSLISIMAVNNEIGSKNDIMQISNICKKHNIPFHTDAVQIFGKERINLGKMGIDAISVSFHKFYGPKGLGLLILSNNLIEGYQLQSYPIIYGTQQQGLLGGTENVALITSGLAALKYTFINRGDKNKKLSSYIQYIIEKLSEHIPIGDYRNYVEGHAYDESDQKSQVLTEKKPYELVIMGPPSKPHRVCNTLLISIVSNKTKFCNQKLVKCLLENNVIVSIGSACNTENKNASHVLQAINAPDKIKSGIIRISVGDFNNMSQIKQFIDIFLKCVAKQIPNIVVPHQKKKK